MGHAGVGVEGHVGTRCQTRKISEEPLLTCGCWEETGGCGVGAWHAWPECHLQESLWLLIENTIWARRAGNGNVIEVIQKGEMMTWSRVVTMEVVRVAASLIGWRVA